MAISAKLYNIKAKIRGAEDTTYVGVGCHTAFENLMHKGTRDLAGNPCKNLPAEGEVDDNGKRLKAKTFDNGSITYIYNPTATDGQKTINDAFDDETTDVKLTIQLSLDDKGTGSAPTIWTRDVLVSSVEIVENDDEYEEKVSLEFLNAPTKTDRVA